MLRSNRLSRLRATPLHRVWAAEEDDTNAPPTTFRNVRPGRLLRLWRQIRQRAWMLYVLDEQYDSPNQEGYLHQQRLEQVCFAPLSAYGMVPGSYCDPLLYNTKNTSPFRWHMSHVSNDIVGHWYLEGDEIVRLRDWQPTNPEDPLEMFPRPPQTLLKWDESVDEHGNRTFRYKYSYDFMGPTGKWEAYPRYPFAHMHAGSPDHHGGRMEGYGFKQGHLLRCDEEEEEVLRRIMEEEDKEWDMVKRTEVVQEPWSYPGKIRPQDFKGAVERAKARFREQIKAGKETDPSEDPDYDLVQAGEMVEPRDGPRAEWRHLWTSNRQAHPLPYQVTFNDGISFEDNEGRPPVHPDSHYEDVPKEAPYRKYEDADTTEALASEEAVQAANQKSFEEAMERHRQLFGDTAGPPTGPKAPLPTGCPPMTVAPGDISSDASDVSTVPKAGVSGGGVGSDTKPQGT